AFLVVVIVLVLEGHEPGAVRMPAEEDLGTRVRIEGGLKRELQRPGDEVVLARLRQVDRGEEVARHRQLGVQRLERTLPADEGRGLSCGRRVRGVDAAPASRRGRGRGTERGEGIIRRRIGGRRLLALLQPADDREQAVELRAQTLDLEPQGIPRRRVLRDRGRRQGQGDGDRRCGQEQGDRTSPTRTTRYV